MTGILAVAPVRRALLAVGVVAVLPVGSALADTTIGQTGGDAPCFPAAPGIVFADTNYVVPVGGGRITSFAFQSDTTDSGQLVDFMVLRPTATVGNYTVVGKTGSQTLSGLGAETFPANIAVQGGDIIGFWTVTGDIPTPFANCQRFVASGGGVIGAVQAADPGVGDPVSFNRSESDVDLNESANLGPTTPTLPTSKAQCRNGGWKSFGVFKNQGDCVSFVVTGGKNPPAAALDSSIRRAHRLWFRRHRLTPWRLSRLVR